MTEQLLAVAASVPSPTAGALPPIPIPLNNVPPQTIASFTIVLEPDAPVNNRVELNATVGAAGTLSNPKVILRVFRDGIPIFSTQQGIQTAAEQFYTIRLTTADFNVSPGVHIYSLTVERTTPADTASVLGPSRSARWLLDPSNKKGES